jgi:4-hydroxybenzoate adenylyltransferase
MRRPSPNANLAELLTQWSTCYGWNDRAVFVTGDDSYTHDEAHDGGARVASLLRARGVRPGDRVLITLHDSIEFVWSFLGTVRLGAVAVLAGPGLAATEHALLAHEMTPAVTVCPAADAWRFADPFTVEELALGLPAAPLAAAHPVAADTTAFVHYSPTGRMVAYGHRDPENRYVTTGVDTLGLHEDALLLSTIPACAVFGLDATVFFPIFCGGASVLCPSHALRDVEEQARRHRPTLLFGAPPFYGGLIAGGDRSAFGSLRSAVCQSGTLPPNQVASLAEWLGCPLLIPEAPVGRGHAAAVPAARMTATGHRSG